MRVKLSGLRMAVPLQAGMVITQLAASVALAHVLSVHDRGVVLTALLLVGVAVSLIAGGLSSALSRAAGGPAGVGPVAWKTALALSLVSVPILLVVAYIAPGAQKISPFLFLTLGPLGVVGTSLAAVAAGSGRIALAVMIQWTPSATALLVLSAVAVSAVTFNLEEAFAAYVGGNVLAVIGGVVGLRRTLAALVRDRSADGHPSSRKFLSDVAWMHPASISQLMGLRLDVVLLAYISGPASASVYTAATSFASPLQLPMMAARGRIIAVGDDTLQHPRRAIRLTALWLGTVSIGLVAAVPLVTLVYGHGYKSAEAPALILIVAGVLLFIRDAEANTLMGAGRAPAVSTIEILVAIVSIAVYYPLIEAADSVGAAVGSVAIYALAVAAFTLTAIRYRRMPGRLTP